MAVVLKFLKIAVVALLAAAAVSCSAEKTVDNPSGAASRYSSPGAKASPGSDESSLVAPKSPLEAYYLSPREMGLIQYATHSLAGECMRAAGFDYQVPKLGELTAAFKEVEELSAGRLFGITDLAAARVYGYSEPPFLSIPGPKIESAAAQAAFTGSSGALDIDDLKDADFRQGGCFGEAQRELGVEGDNGSDRLARSLAVQAYFRAEAKPGFAAVNADWGACMEERNFVIENPSQPGKSTAFQVIKGDQGKAEKASAAEIDLATADIECKREVDLVGRLGKLVNKEAEALLEKNVLALDEARRDADAALRDAAAAVGLDS